MQIQNGDVITLDNGDIVKVTLQKIGRKVEKLIPGNLYKLTRNGEFCHVFTNSGAEFSFGEDRQANVYQYVGVAYTTYGHRHIFFLNSPGNTEYVMFSTRTLDFVVEEVPGF